ncbi:MAG: hypothetical protein KIT24_00365 [Phycisphaeraceae bacterium]|nr:hypothetical protein [Phycisphaeraceae bacterium]
MKNLMTAAAGIVLAAGVASAQVKFLTSDGSTLYRTDGIFTESFDMMGAHTIGMTVVPAGMSITGATAGDVIAIDDQRNAQGRYNVYRVDNAYTGTPTLVTIGESNRVSNSLVFAGGNLYGANGLNQQFRIHELSLVDFLGSNDVASGFSVLGVGGLAFDGSGFFFTDNGSNSLYGYDLGTNTVTTLGNSGVSFFNQGLEYFQGQLWGAVQIAGGNLVIGTWNTTNGAFTQVYDVAPHVQSVTGFVAIIPAPGSLGLLAVGGMIALRRRR